MRACRMPLPRRPLHYFIAGLIVAEGSFGKEEYRNTGRFTFTNTDPTLIKLVYRFLVDELKIPQNKIYLYITYNTELSKISREDIKEFWHKTIGVNPNYIKIYPYKRKVKQVRQRAHYGICQIRINDKNIRRKIETFINTIKTNIVCDLGGEGAYG